MLKFTVKSDLNTKLTAALARASSRAEHAIAQQAKKDTEPFVPARTKTLANATKVVGNQIIYPGPYARYLYYGKLMVDPETGSSWAKRDAKKVLTDRNLVFSTAVHPQAQSHWFEASKAQNLEKWERVAAKAMDHFGENNE